MTACACQEILADYFTGTRGLRVLRSLRPQPGGFEGLLCWFRVNDHRATTLLLPARSDDDLLGVPRVANHRHALGVPHVHAKHFCASDRLRQDLSDLRHLRLKRLGEVRYDRILVATLNRIGMLLDVVLHYLLVHRMTSMLSCDLA
jgi:hypothetical protein